MAGSEKIRGALLGAACGDALGYPLHALSTERIRRRFGPYGLRTLVRDPRNEGNAPISENTQLLLATVDGLLWADAKKLDWSEGLYRGYMRWYYNQTGAEPRQGQRTWMRRQPHEREICLIREKWMHARRSVEDGLLTTFMTDEKGTVNAKINDSLGSSVLTRAIPVGIICGGSVTSAFTEGVKAGALSHSQPAAYQACGALSALISALSANTSLPKALEKVLRLLHKTEGAETLAALLGAAEEQANNHPAGKQLPWAHQDALASLGTGKRADEALAMAVYIALAEDDPFEAVITAANQSVQGVTVAAVTGAIEGLRFGFAYLPSYWTDVLEGRETILALADKLFHMYQKSHTK